MTVEQIFNLLIAPVAIAVWVFLTKVVVPWIFKDRTDRREFQQENEGVAFKQAIKITDNVLAALIKQLDDKKDLERHLEGLGNDKVRTSEILTDIDLMFHKLETLYNESNRSNSQPDSPDASEQEEPT